MYMDWSLRVVYLISSITILRIMTYVMSDVMHDILEGVTPYEVILLLTEVIVTRQLLSLEEFNRILSHFEYGSIMSSSKPSEIMMSRLQGSDSLGQHAH